jgi:hypothetical protein
MSEEKKASRKFTVRYATDEDYKRMNFYTVGTLYRAETIMARLITTAIDSAPGDPSGRGLPNVNDVNESAEG